MTATPKPRAGEHTPMTTKLIDDMLHGAGIPRCDEWDKLVRHSRALETSVYRGISDIERIEAERDDLAKALEACDKAIRGVIGDGPVRGNGTPYPVWADMISAAVQARSILAKHGR